MLSRQTVGMLAIALVLPASADTTNARRLLATRGRNLIELKPSAHHGKAEVDLNPPSTAPLTMHLAANADVAYEVVCKLRGITVVFDPNFRPPKITLDLTDVTLREALDTVSLLSKTGWHVVTPQMILVYPKAPNP